MLGFARLPSEIVPMRVIIAVAVCALLSGCAMDWSRDMAEPRFTWSDNSAGPAADPATQERHLRQP